jgi:transposase
MSKATTHEGVRRMRFVSLLDRQERREITQEEAAEILGMNVRTFQRWAERYREEGDDGLADRRIGRLSPRRAPAAEIERMLGLYADKYSDFTVQHFHQALKKHHNYKLGYTVTKKGLQDAGLVRVAPKRSAHRKKRAPRPLPGMMLHQDGSRHASGSARSDRDAGRCDEPDPVGVPGRGGGHGVDIPRTARSGRAGWIVLLTVYRSRQPLLVHT